MGQLKNRLLFLGLSISAYASPFLMIVSIFTHYWLHSTEKISGQTSLKEKLQTTTTSTTSTLLNSNNTSFSRTTNNVNLFYAPLEYIEASYGLWKMCRITDTSRQKRCEYIKYFQGSDSENRVTDTLKKQIGVCIVPIFISLFIMITSVILHTYAFVRKKLQYLFLLSGCLFIFAGLASLTALIVFIAAVNGAVDNKLTLNKSKEEEPLFNYNYGFSFFCSVFSFLMQEFNGICNIYWYIDYYRKYRLNKTSQGDSKLTRIGRIPIIKVNYVDFNEPSAKTKTSELSPSLSNNNNNNRSLNFEINEIKKLNSADEKESGNETENKLFILRKPSINKQHKLKHKIYKSNFRKDNPKIGFNFDQSDQEYEDDSSKLSETVENTNENSSESNLIRSIEHLKSAPTPTKSNDTPPPLPLALPVPSNKFATQSNKAQTGLKRPEESSLPTSTSSSATSTPIKSSISSMSNTSEISSLCPPLMNSDKFKKDVLIKGGRAFVTNNNNNKKNRKKEQTVLTVNEKSSKMDLDENDLKIKFYKLDQEYRLQNENNYSVLKKHPSVQYYQNKYTYQHKSPPRQQQQQQQGQKSSQKPSPLNLNLTNAKMTQKQRQDSFKKSPKFIYFSQDQEHANQIEAEKQRPIISNSNSSSKIFQYPSFLNTEFSSLADTSNHAYFNNKLNSKSSNIYSAYTNDEDLAEELIRPLTVAMANAASAAALAAASYITNRTNQFSGNQAAPSRSTNKFQRIKSNRPQMKRNKSLTDYYKLSKMPNTNANHNYQPVTKYILHDDYTNEFQLRNRSTNLLNNLNARLLACSNMSANAQLIFSKPNLKRTTSV